MHIRPGITPSECCRGTSLEYRRRQYRNDAESVLEALRAQGGHYVLETVSSEGDREYEEIASVRTMLPWPEDLQPLIETGAHPDTRIIAFIVAEAGYYLNTEHKLKIDNPDIQVDLRRVTKPCMAPSVKSLSNAWRLMPIL